MVQPMQIKAFLYPAKIAVMCMQELMSGETASALISSWCMACLTSTCKFCSDIMMANHVSLCTYHIVSCKKASPVPNRWLIDVCYSNQFIDYEYPLVIWEVGSPSSCHSYPHNKHIHLIPCLVLDPQYCRNQLLRKRYTR